MYNTSAFFVRMRLLYLDLHEFARCKLTSEELHAILGAALFTLASKRWYCRHFLGRKERDESKTDSDRQSIFSPPFVEVLTLVKLRFLQVD